MKYIKKYEDTNEPKFFVFVIPKNDNILISAINHLEEINELMDGPELKFDVYSSDENDKENKYFIISNKLPSYNFTINKDELNEFGEKVDYKTIIAANKYNL